MLNYYGARRRGHERLSAARGSFSLATAKRRTATHAAWRAYRAKAVAEQRRGKKKFYPNAPRQQGRRRLLQSCARNRIEYGNPARKAPGPHQARTQLRCRLRWREVRLLDRSRGAGLAQTEAAEPASLRPKPRSRPCGTGDRHDPDFGTCPRGVPRKVPLQTGRFFCALFGPKESGDKAVTSW